MRLGILTGSQGRCGMLGRLEFMKSNAKFNIFVLIIMRNAFVSILILSMLSACTEDYSYEFVLENGSARTVFMNVQQRGSSTIDSSLIAPGSALVLGVDIVDARNANRARDRVEVPFEMLQVTDLDGNVPNLCNQSIPSSLQCWGVPEGERKVRHYRVMKFFRENNFD